MISLLISLLISLPHHRSGVVDFYLSCSLPPPVKLIAQVVIAIIFPDYGYLTYLLPDGPSISKVIMKIAAPCLGALRRPSRFCLC